MSLQHILKNSSISGKEPLASQLANGELSINYHADGPFLCCKDTAGNVRRVAGVWVATTAPSTPFPGELWLDTSSTPTQLKVYKDTTDAWVFAGEVNTATTTTEGLVRLATDVDTQAGTNATSAVTPASLQSKISDSTSTVSSTTIASSSAVKTLADTVNAALPKSGGTITGTLEIGNTGQLRFEGSSNDAYETTLAVEDPTGTRTITLPDRTGTVITTGDTGTVTSTMIVDGTIVDADINASAAIAHSKLASLNSAQVLLGNASNVPTATTVTGDVTISDAGVTSIASGVIVDADINSDAEIAVSKLADGTSRQLLQTDTDGTGVEWTSNVDIPGTLDVTGATTLDSTLSVPLGSAAAPSINFAGDNTGIYSPGADQLALGTGGTGRLFINSSGNVGIGDSYTKSILSLARNNNSTKPSDSASIVLTNRSSDLNGNIAGGIFADCYRDVANPSITAGIWFTRNSAEANLASTSNILFGSQGLATDALPAERMRIDNYGRVGIGTSSPAAALDVVGAGLPNCYISTTKADATSKYSLIASQQYSSAAEPEGVTVIGSELTASANNIHIGGYFGEANASTSIIFSTASSLNTRGGSERMRLTSEGKLGIGTSSPATLFHATGAALIRGGNQSSSNNAPLPSETSPLSVLAYTGYLASPSTSINIGAANFDAVNNGNPFRYSITTPGGGGLISFAVNSVEYNGSTFITKERASIDSSGNVGIGTSSPTTLLDVNSDTVRVRTTRTPASATATGAAGEICWDASYIYVCTATNTWKRAALSSW